MLSRPCQASQRESHLHLHLGQEGLTKVVEMLSPPCEAFLTVLTISQRDATGKYLHPACPGGARRSPAVGAAVERSGCPVTDEISRRSVLTRTVRDYAPSHPSPTSGFRVPGKIWKKASKHICLNSSRIEPSPGCHEGGAVGDAQAFKAPAQEEF